MPRHVGAPQPLAYPVAGAHGPARIDAAPLEVHEDPCDHLVLGDECDDPHHRQPAPKLPDPMTECLYVSEFVELARTNFTQLNWDQTWSDGAITTDIAVVQDGFRNIEE